MAAAWRTTHGFAGCVRKPARAAAFDVLRRVFEDDAYADRALRTRPQRGSTRGTGRSRRGLAYGAVQRVRTLDHVIEKLGRRRVPRLDPPVRAALRLGAYQLGYVDGVARYAAVNESVELVRRAGLERAVASRTPCSADSSRDRPGSRSLRDDSATAAALRHSYPDWVAETWWRDLGAEDARALMRAHNDPAPTVVRLVRGAVEASPTPTSPAPGTSSGSTSERSRRGGSGRRAPRRSSSGSPSVRASPSGPSISARLRAGRPTMLAGEVVAVEVNEGRARELTATIKRLGAADVRVVVADGRDAAAGADRLRPCARRCSLLGARRPQPPSDLRWRAMPLPELQLELLRAAAERVRPGGRIVYSVCTINADEAEEVVDVSGLEVDPTLGTSGLCSGTPGRPEFLQTLPHVHGTAGFFVARLIAR